MVKLINNKIETVEVKAIDAVSKIKSDLSEIEENIEGDDTSCDMAIR